MMECLFLVLLCYVLPINHKQRLPSEGNREKYFIINSCIKHELKCD